MKTARRVLRQVFWLVIVQILILDAIFSLDSIITAVGMVDNLGVMMAAVVIAIGVMMLASRPLTAFVNAHPTVVVLCLSFLLMIGLSLVADGFGFHIPKGYLYAAIGFSVMIEFFNQLAARNLRKHTEKLPFRARTLSAIVNLMGRPGEKVDTAAEGAAADRKPDVFAEEERHMVEGVLSFGGTYGQNHHDAAALRCGLDRSRTSRIGDRRADQA